MKFFEDRKKREYEVDKVYVLTTDLVSDYDDGNGCSPGTVTAYYLATKKDDKYYELFSGVYIEGEFTKDGSSKPIMVRSFNTPYIMSVEPLRKHIKDMYKKLNSEELFYFITEMNLTEVIKKF